MNYVKRAIALAVLILTLLGTAVTGRAQLDYEAFRQSVFRVVVLTEDRQSVQMMGTGFAVGRSAPVEYIVTNYHVIKDNIKGVGVMFDDQNTLVFAEVIKVDEILDIAILKTSTTIDRPPMQLGKKDFVRASDAVYAYGFPRSDVSDYQISRPEDVTLTSGVVSKMAVREGNDYYQIDAAINKGNSGGPLLHKEGGFVIGVNSFRIMESDNINASLMIDQVLPLLDELNIAYLEYTGATAPEATPSATEGSATPDASASPLPTAPSEKKSGSSILWLVVFIFAGVALVGVLGYIAWQWWRGRDVGGSYSGAQGPVLVGVSGQYRGAVLPIEEGSVLIGRDPRECQIVFDKNTAGVSRVHCQVRYDEKAGVFVIKDMSSVGTIVAGRPIGQGHSITMDAGEVFYLGDRSHGFRVEIGGAQ